MSAQNIFSLFLFLSFIGSLFFLGYSLKHRHEVGVRSFSMMVSGQVIISIGYLFEIQMPELEQKIFWDNIQFFGADTFAIGSLLFAISYAQRRPPKWLLGLMASYFLADIVLVWIDPLTQLVRTTSNLDISGLFPVLAYDYGLWFWVFSAVFELIMFTTLGILIWQAINVKGLFRVQLLLIIFAFAIPQFGTFLIISGNVPIPNMPNLDITPILLMIATPLLGFSIIRFHLLVAAPIAKTMLLENIRDAIVVIDNRSQVTMTNQLAEKLFGLSSNQELGKAIHEVMPKLAEIINNQPAAIEWETKTNFSSHDGQMKYFSIKGSSLQSASSIEMGTLIILQDITIENQLQEQLKQMAYYDSLTGAMNRHSFYENMIKEIKRSIRYHHSFSFIILDIDYFKKTNDNFGHLFGDTVLKTLVEKIIELLRKPDTIFRYGGEEFAILLPETPIDGGMIAAERMRQTLMDHIFTSPDGESTQITVSIGVTEFDYDGKQTLEDLIREADEALYQAKESGRNRSVQFTQD